MPCSQSTEITGEDGVPLTMATYSFQLKGKKELLKDMREKHDGFVVSLTGELKTTLTERVLVQHEDWTDTKVIRGRRSREHASRRCRARRRRSRSSTSRRSKGHVTCKR